MKISIIVPVYNIEKYIHRCIDSLLAQTYKDLEILLVDDGSSDRSGTICDQYTQADQRVKVIHQTNGGVSRARQRGLDAATGTFIIHADPDDWMEATMCEKLIAKAVEEKADMVFCDYWLESAHPEVISQRPNSLNSYDVLRQIVSYQLHGASWNKLIRKDVLSKYGCRFTPTDIHFCEDILFHARLLINDIKISYLPEALYHYNISNNTSLTNTFSEKKIRSWLKVIEELKSILRPQDFDALYFLEKDVLYAAFILRKNDLLKSLYPQTRERFIHEHPKYRLFTPNSSCLALALKGYPKTANMLYHVTLRIIRLKTKIRKRFKI